MKEKELNDFLRSLSLESEFRVLDEAKDKNEIEEIAKKYGITWPSPDIAIFRSKYAFTEKANKNGCRLPKEEVESSLGTLAHKAVDIDHLRKKVVGHYLGADLVEDTIYADGIFFKSNFGEDFETIQSLMNKGNLKVSFEAWGNREPLGDGTYNLTDITWAGGALLIDTKPAFPDAGVVEIAKAKMLEMASTMTIPETFVQDKRRMEKSRFYSDEMYTIDRLMWETECPNCHEKGSQIIDLVDFKNNNCETECFMCGAKCKVKFTPRIEERKEEARAIDNIVLIDTNSNKSTEEDKKMELEELKKELAAIKERLAKKDEEIAALKAEVEKTKEEATAKETAFVAEKAEAIKLAKEQAIKVTERKAALGEEFSKEMSDEDLLNDDKFEKAQLKKENAELKAKVVAPEKANADEDPLVVGTKKKDVKDTDNIFSKQKTIQKMAFGE